MPIGLTGGIGCGKSTVLKLFKELGWKTIDADALCHGLYEDPCGALSAGIRARWGGGFFKEDGRADRRKIAELVFDNPDELRWLNSVIHPLVLKAAEDNMRRSGADVIFDVPLLFEAGWQSSFDATVAVWTDKASQVSRLRKKGLSPEDIARRIKFQMPADEKLEKADYGLINTGDIRSLGLQCASLNKTLKDNYGK
jgi:dephospho-CoA kinase